jgi:hypothetical protein
MPKEESGIDKIGDTEIPWTRHGSEEDWMLTYGPDPADHARRRKEKIGGKLRTVSGTTLLVRHVRRGSSSWDCVYDGRHGMSTAFTNRMQGIIGTPDGDWLISLVDILQNRPFDMDDASDPHRSFDPGRSWARLCKRIRQADDAEFARLISQFINWWQLLPFLADDVARGQPHYTQMLARIIDAQSLRKRERSFSLAIIDAAVACANRLDRLPTKSEVREEYNSRHLHDGGLGNREFSRALTLAGLAWLPVRL